MVDNSELKEIELNRVNVDMRQTQHGKDYFIIFDEDGEQGANAYFCFRGETDALNHADFERLKDEWHTITRIKLTYFEKDYNGRTNKRVVGFKLPEKTNYGGY